MFLSLSLIDPESGGCAWRAHAVCVCVCLQKANGVVSVLTVAICSVGCMHNGSQKMDKYDHLFKLLLIGDAGVGKSR